MAASGLPAGSRLHVAGETWHLSADLLGKGGFANVYRCRSQRGQSGAAKVVNLKESSKWVKTKLKTEASALEAAQSHPHIIRFYGTVRRGAHHIFILEAWGSDLLEQVLRDRGLGGARTLPVVEQVLSALRWLHGMRICHGCVLPPPPSASPPYISRDCAAF